MSFALLLALAGASGCGRSSLNDYIEDAGATDGTFEGGGDDGSPESGVCSALTCKSGCCDLNGNCRPGDTMNACGSGGEACADCQKENFQFCDKTQHACGNAVDGACGPGTCASGCCYLSYCYAGSDQNLCGTGGQTCQHCLDNGLSCQGQQCVKSTCGPSTCGGCCFGNTCLGGQDPTSCGIGGQQCQNCAANGETCIPQGGTGGICGGNPTCGPSNCKGCCDSAGKCESGASDTSCGFGGGACQDCALSNESCAGGSCVPSPPCGPPSCPNGCCQGNSCVGGTSNTACGTGGAACVNCLSSNETCQGQVCVNKPPTCNSSTCPGCCDSNQNCQGGFLDNQCGENGAACVNCTGLNPPSTCDVNVNPRVCTSQQSTCPAPYNSCPGNVTTPPPKSSKACTSSDLSQASSACSAGAHTAGCQSFFAFEKSQNPACGSCLAQFDYDFMEGEGLFVCLEPYVSSSCNHDTGCVIDCETQSCVQCPDQNTRQACYGTVRQGQCSTYFNQISCIFGGFFGQGAFCSPQQYGGNFGAWLAGVGKHYCE